MGLVVAGNIDWGNIWDKIDWGRAPQWFAAGRDGRLPEALLQREEGRRLGPGQRPTLLAA
jgi:hypothetical protein